MSTGECKLILDKLVGTCRNQTAPNPRLTTLTRTKVKTKKTTKTMTVTCKNKSEMRVTPTQASA